MVWSLALRPDDAKQDPVVYDTKSGVVFLAEGPRIASIEKGFDCFGLYHPGLENVCVCVCVFIKLHITAQSGLVILVIICHSH